MHSLLLTKGDIFTFNGKPHVVNSIEEVVYIHLKDVKGIVAFGNPTYIREVNDSKGRVFRIAPVNVTKERVIFRRLDVEDIMGRLPHHVNWRDGFGKRLKYFDERQRCSCCGHKI